MTSAITRAGQVVSAVFYPASTVPAGCALVGITAAGVGWGLVFAASAAVPPVVAVMVLHAAGVFPSLRIPSRRHRIILLASTIAWEAVLAAAYTLTGAPHHLAGLQAAMTGGLAAVAAMTFATRVSVHVAVLSIFAAATATTAGNLWMAAIGILIVIVGTARIIIRAHTPIQVILGATIPGIIVSVGAAWLCS